MAKTKRKVGRPTKYKKKYCKDIVEFFSNDPFRIEEVDIYGKDGNVIKTEQKMTANLLSFFSAYARKIGVDTDTLLNWKDKHKEFFGAYKKCKELQKEYLITNGLLGNIDKTFAIFTAKNITDMRDNKDVNLTTEGELKVTGCIGMPPEIDVKKEG